ncbi:hypothetical protein PLICRDRAFT_350537 [Plicaturopsis crispa FD-325 SS-3]|uniref:Peroxisomal ATPase PEX1 n=1 Tax=Plicaturopsis crispa FD-325 SS-3 TaxID=944288 RepID=A0A0C9SRS8_PLICR|nr:hypothetical protein PLICRDRAFT_350537 [Plicaturopsis crispa FD-325 SS-3]
MPRRARIEYAALRSSLVNLPISIYGPLLERSVRPQGLAVHLIRVPPHNSSARTADARKVEAYVGWTGMAASSSLAHLSRASENALETVEMDPQYAQALGLVMGDVVEIGLLHDLGIARGVGAEPVSTDDWEIIETHAGHLEQALLSQVRVACAGQEVDVWVLGRTRVRLRIVSLDPAPSKAHRALLLGNNTEVSVAPKVRSSNAKKPSASASAPVPANPEQKKESAQYAPHILRVLPSHILKEADLDAEVLRYTAREPLVLVSRRTHALLSNSSDRGKGSSVKPRSYLHAILRPVHPPVHPIDSTASTSTPPLTRILHPGTTDTIDKEKEKTAQEKAKGKVAVRVGIFDGIPDSHVVLSNAADDEAWGLVKITATGQESSRSALFANSASRETTKARRPANAESFLAGVDDILARCTDFCTRTLALHSQRTVALGVSALLVTGRAGAGKTSIVQSVARTLREDPRAYAYTLYVDLGKYVEHPVSQVKSLFAYWFAAAVWHKPTVLVFDNMEKLLGTEVEHADSFRTRHIVELFVAQFGSAARSAAPNARAIVVLGAAQSQAALHPLLFTAHLFDDIVNVKPPNKEARKDIIVQIIKERMAHAPDMQKDPESPLNYTALATQTEGYSATDLQDLVARAVHHAAIRASKEASDHDATTMLSSVDFETAQVDFTPLSLRDVKLQKSDVEWSDIGGLQETRRVLRETLEWPTKYGPIFAQSPLRLRSGLLLYGFPGCGKTLLASAVAKECGLNFISVKGPEILNKYIGASEKSVRDLFERASAAKPCVLFFDEFDSIAPKRGHDSTGVTDRVVNQMLTQMDGAEGLDGVYVLAATSRPDLIDSALLRPGRLDKSLLCNMPDASERKDILQAVSRKVSLAPTVDLDAIARATEGFSGADLQALVYNAHLEVVHASISSVPTDELGPSYNEDAPVEYSVVGGQAGTGVVSKAEEAALQRRLQQIKRSAAQTRSGAPSKGHATSPKKHEITDAYLRRVLQTTRPSVSPEEQYRLRQIYKAFVSDRSGDLPVPPDAGGVGNRASLM